jgi:hypothetical protein
MSKKTDLGLAALGVAVALVTTVGAASAAHHFHGFNHDHRFWPYGGVIEAYPLGGLNSPVNVASAPLPMTPVVAPKFALTCQHSQQIVTVPSEDGGERKIVITRC